MGARSRSSQSQVKPSNRWTGTPRPPWQVAEPIGRVANVFAQCGQEMPDADMQVAKRAAATEMAPTLIAGQCFPVLPALGNIVA